MMSRTKAAGNAASSIVHARPGRAFGNVYPVILALAGGVLTGLLLETASGSLTTALIGGGAVFCGIWAGFGLRTVFRGAPSPDDPLGPAVLAAVADAMAVVEDGVQVVVANAAYRRLCRSDDQVPPPERFLARVPGVQAAVAELLDAVADGRAHTCRIGLDSGAGGRRIEVRVAPLDSPRRVLWSLRLVEPEAESPPPEMPAGPDMLPSPLPEDAVAALLEAWERAPAGVARFTRDRVILANAGFCRLLGYGLAEWPVDGMPLEEVVAPGFMARLRAAVEQAPGSLVLDLTRKDGEPVSILLDIGKGNATGAASVVALPRAALPVAEPAPMPVVASIAPLPAPDDAADVDRFFLRAPLALAVVDADGRIRAANAAFARLFEPDAESESAGRPLTSVIAERDAPAVEAFLAEVRTGAAPALPCDVAATGTGGRSARLYAAPLGIATGPRDDVALCAIDTTEQKALEAQFAQSQRLQAVGHLAGGVAHDFNNVLTAIIGYCDLLLAKHRPSDPSFPDIMQINQNANRAAALVRQLLAFSRRQTLRPQAVELTDVISDVSELLRRLIGERITLEVQHTRDLWPVRVDVNQFEQVIVNLVVNARDAMPGGGTLTLRTANVPADACAAYGASLTPEDYVLVEVEDTGSGIPPEIIDKIFEPFFSTKEVGKGTGLGLSTVYGIVQQTGGTILAASELGKGSVFRVFLPRHVPAVEDEAPRPAEPEVKMGDSTGQGRILLVEDEDAVRAFASRALSARGYEVLTAASGVEALEVLAAAGQKVDLVISDVVMPEMDGPSLLRELRARDPLMKVIFISGYAEEAFARNLPPSEHFAFLPKPFSLKQLVASVNTALRGGD